MSSHVQLQRGVLDMVGAFLTPETVSRIMASQQIGSLDSQGALDAVTRRCIAELRPLISDFIVNRLGPSDGSKINYTPRNFTTLLLDNIPSKLQEITRMLEGPNQG